MIRFVKNAAVSLKYQQDLAALTAKRKHVELVRSAGVMLDGELPTNDKHFISLASILGLPVSKMMVLVYTKEKMVVPHSRVNKTFVNYGDISITAGLSNTIKGFFSNDFDIFFNYFNRKDLAMQFISLQCKNAFRVGFNKVDNRLNDLIFNFEIENKPVFLRETKKYLNTIFNTTK